MKKASRLTDSDNHLLFALYEFRCLSLEQAYKYYYSELPSQNNMVLTRIEPMRKMDLIDVVQYKEGAAIFLKREGIDIIRDEFELPTNIIDEETNAIKRGYYTAGELNMNPRLVAHQVRLNEFVLQFDRRANEHLNWKHYGEKFVSSYFGIRPDALIKVLNVDIFLEQDMNSESQVQLMGKWENYRNYLRSKEHELNAKKIIVFFIIDNIKRKKTIQDRKNVVRATATEGLIDLLGDDFDIVIGTREELLDYAFKQLIPTLKLSNPFHTEFLDIMKEKHGFIMRDADKLCETLDGTFSFYGVKTDQKGNILTENGRMQEYIFDDATHNPLSMLHKIDYHKRSSAQFRRTFGRGMSFIFIVRDEDEIQNILKISEMTGRENIFYTTIERLKNRSFNEAIFNFDSLDNRYSFKNNGLVTRVFET